MKKTVLFVACVITGLLISAQPLLDTTLQIRNRLYQEYIVQKDVGGQKSLSPLLNKAHEIIELDHSMLQTLIFQGFDKNRNLETINGQLTAEVNSLKDQINLKDRYLHFRWILLVSVTAVGGILLILAVVMIILFFRAKKELIQAVTGNDHLRAENRSIQQQLGEMKDSAEKNLEKYSGFESRIAELTEQVEQYRTNIVSMTEQNQKMTDLQQTANQQSEKLKSELEALKQQLETETGTRKKMETEIASLIESIKAKL